MIGRRLVSATYSVMREGADETLWDPFPPRVLLLMFPGPSRSLQHHRPPWRPVSVRGRRPQVVPHRHPRQEGTGRARLRHSGRSGPDHPDGLWRQIKYTLLSVCQRLSLNPVFFWLFAPFHLTVFTTPGWMEVFYLFMRKIKLLFFCFGIVGLNKTPRFWMWKCKTPLTLKNIFLFSLLPNEQIWIFIPAGCLKDTPNDFCSNFIFTKDLFSFHPSIISEYSQTCFTSRTCYCLLLSFGAVDVQVLPSGFNAECQTVRNRSGFISDSLRPSVELPGAALSPQIS